MHIRLKSGREVVASALFSAAPLRAAPALRIGTACDRRLALRTSGQQVRAASTSSGVFRLRGVQSRKYIRAKDGHLFHDDRPTNEHSFVFVPGTGRLTGTVKLHHLASDSPIFMTQDGLLGSFQGDFEDHYWDLLLHEDERTFWLQSHLCGMRLYSNADGRLGSFPGESFDDQLFQSEDGDGHTVQICRVHGCLGLQDTGFQWSWGGTEPPVYTDAFNVGHYVLDPGNGQLCEVRELTRMQLAPSWGSARDLELHSMDRPHAWAIEHIPLLSRLQQAGLISADHPSNAVYRPSSDLRSLEFRGNGLRPSGAIKFALRPVSDGRHVPFERSWLRAWHGAPRHAVETIASRGLQSGQKNNIYLSPSFQYTFCLYSVPDIMVGPARLRLVFEVRVKPGSYQEHGDHYKFCITELIEQVVPADRLEWELLGNASAVQVVGLVLKQLEPHHPTLRHDTIVRHACKALIHE